MNKELAESYVRKLLLMMDFSFQARVGLWGFFAAVCTVFAFLYHTIFFILCVCVVLLTHLLALFLFRRNWNGCSIMLAHGFEALFLGLETDLWLYALYRITDRFVLVEYCVMIAIQIFFLVLAMNIVPPIAKRHNAEKKPFIIKFGWGMALSMGFFSRACVAFFSNDGMDHYIVDFFAILAGVVLVSMLNYRAVTAFYRAHLIKKFHLEIDLEQLAKEKKQSQT